MVDAVGVGDQRVGDRAQIQHLIPVGVVARQPRHLASDDDADPAQADSGDQVGEPVPPGYSIAWVDLPFMAAGLGR
jgi:hypothetical protein